MGSGKQVRAEPVRVRRLRFRSSQLHRRRVRHGTAQDRPLRRRQPNAIRARQRNAGKSTIHPSDPLISVYVFGFHFYKKEKLQYEDGFVGIPHPLSVVVGVVQR